MRPEHLYLGSEPQATPEPTQLPGTAAPPETTMTDHWVPACGGTEQPFRTRTGRTLQYLWNQTTGEHAYYDLTADLFLTNEEADAAIWGDNRS